MCAQPLACCMMQTSFDRKRSSYHLAGDGDGSSTGGMPTRWWTVVWGLAGHRRQDGAENGGQYGTAACTVGASACMVSRAKAWLGCSSFFCSSSKSWSGRAACHALAGKVSKLGLQPVLGSIPLCCAQQDNAETGAAAGELHLRTGVGGGTELTGGKGLAGGGDALQRQLLCCHFSSST